MSLGATRYASGGEPVTDFMGAARFEWCLMAFGVGIALYFAWPVEPVWWWGITGLVGILLGLVFLSLRPRLAGPVLLCALCLAGFSRSAVHSHFVSAPILPNYERSYEVTGWIEDVNKSGPLQHFYIRVHSIARLEAAKTPHRIRIRIKPRGFVAGDSIKIRAVLSGPRAPALVGGYDPARAAYFKKIGGFGFAISRPQTVGSDDLYPMSKFEVAKRSLSTFRYGLSRRIQQRAPPHTAGLQAALLTGDRSAIPVEQEQSLRAAGLAHLLAISGLHMGLLAGGAYSLASLFFAMIGPLARRYDMRKWAAGIGALMACAYLLLSGASVSTQRAFIMAIVVFAAVILNRRAVSLRSVALAAAITLLLHPESLISAGFQMSFAATAALVVVYRNWANRRVYSKAGGLFQRIKSGFVGISVTSFVAGIATGGFAALHFHRFARLGFFANLAAMPMFTLVVMPAGFMAVLVMPFGLEQYPLKLMGLGLDFVLSVSDWISARESALLYIKGANGVVVSLFGLGFTWLCLGFTAGGGSVALNRTRLIGAGFMVISCGLWFGVERADMRVSDTARVAFWDPQSVNILRVDRKRGDGYGRSRFIERSGQVDAELLLYSDAGAGGGALCDQQACRLVLKGIPISIVNEPEGVIEACLDSDLVVLTQRSVGPRARALCKAIILDTHNLAIDGARDIYFHKDGIKIKPANPQARQRRPWGH